jgi:hypothetical protein
MYITPRRQHTAMSKGIYITARRQHTAMSKGIYNNNNK